MLYIFPDTNIFIHGKDFEQIDWAKITGESNFTLVIAPGVIAELDKHKRNSNRRIADRIRKLLPRIEDILVNNGKSKIKLESITSNPSTEIFVSNKLDPSDADDRILASIIEYSRDHNISALLVTNDTGPRLKSPSLNIKCIKLPDECMIASEPDEMEIANQSLQKELTQLKNRIPVLSLRFMNEKTFLEFEARPHLKSKKEYFTEQMAEIMTKYLLLQHPQDNEVILPNNKKIKLLLNAFNYPSALQVSVYNAELKNFYEECGTFIQSQYEAAVFFNNICEIKLVLSNIGNIPADDIDLHLSFPEGFDIIKKEDFPKKEKKPSPPRKPLHAFDNGPTFSFPEIISPIRSAELRSMEYLSKINSNVGTPLIKKNNGYEVTFQVKTAKHHQTVELDPIYLKFADITKAKGFSIDYKLIARNVPSLIAGKLNVNFAQK